MITLQTKIQVDRITATEIFDFLADPDDESYRAWWPGSTWTNTSGSADCA